MTDPDLDRERLQDQLRDLLSLAVVGDHVRFVTRGDGSDQIATWLGRAVPRWREMAEDVARRMAAKGLAPDGRIRSLAQDIPRNWVPGGWLDPAEAKTLIQDRLDRVASWARAREADGPEPFAEDLIRGLETQLEQLAEMKTG